MNLFDIVKKIGLENRMNGNDGVMADSVTRRAVHLLFRELRPHLLFAFLDRT